MCRQLKKRYINKFIGGLLGKYEETSLKDGLGRDRGAFFFLFFSFLFFSLTQDWRKNESVVRQLYRHHWCAGDILAVNAPVTCKIGFKPEEFRTVLYKSTIILQV